MKVKLMTTLGRDRYETITVDDDSTVRNIFANVIGVDPTIVPTSYPHSGLYISVNKQEINSLDTVLHDGDTLVATKYHWNCGHPE